MPYFLLSGPGSRLALSRPLFITLTNETIECHPLLLYHTWLQKKRRKMSKCFRLDSSCKYMRQKIKWKSTNRITFTLTLFWLFSPPRKSGSLFSKWSSELFCEELKNVRCIQENSRISETSLKIIDTCGTRYWVLMAVMESWTWCTWDKVWVELPPREKPPYLQHTAV